MQAKAVKSIKGASHSQAACAYTTMNREPIHQNLSTSFVNLEALVKHLRGLQFVGSIHVELSSYEADIIFPAPGKIEAREYDHQAGRTSHGMSALKRIMARAREPFGRIHVYRSVPKGYDSFPSGVYIDESIAALARKSLNGKNDSPARHLITLRPAANGDRYLELVEELLLTIHSSLRLTGLDFPEAFRNTCSRMSALYPFLDAESCSVSFSSTAVEVKIRVEREKFTEALGEVLNVLLTRIVEMPGREETRESLRLSLRGFIRHRAAELDRLGLRTITESFLLRV